MEQERENRDFRFLAKPLEGTVDLRVEASGVLPDYCEDIHKILSVDLNAQILKKERYLAEKALVCEVRGIARFRLIYAGESGEGGKLGVCSHEFESEFSHAFEWPLPAVPELEDNYAIFASVQPLGAVCKPLGAKKPSFSGSLRLSVELVQNDRAVYADADKEGVETQSESICFSKLCGAGEQEYSIEQTLTLEHTAKPIQTVLGLDLSIAQSWVKAAENQVAFGALATVRCVYLALDEETGQESVRAFSQPIELSELLEQIDCTPDALVRLQLAPLSARCEVQTDSYGERRVLKLECGYRALCAAFCRHTLSLVRDLYVCRRSAQSTFSDLKTARILCLEESRPECEVRFEAPEKLVQIEHLSAEISGVKLQWDSGALRAGLKLKLSAIGRREDDPRPVFFEENAETELKLRTELGLMEQSENLDVSLSGAVEQIDGVLNAESLLTRLRLALTLTICEMKETRYLSALELGELSPHDVSGVRFYYPDPGETLWEIGKRFGVGQEKLRAQNRIEGDAVPEIVMISR